MTVSMKLNNHTLSMNKTPLGMTVELDGKLVGKTGGAKKSELKFKVFDGKILIVSAVWDDVFPHYTVTLDGTVLYDK